MYGCGPLTVTIGQGVADAKLKMTVVESEGRWFADRVAIIDISGLLINASRPGLLRRGDNPVGLLHEKLEMARRDHRVKAVILRLNTPGGTVTASDAMYRQILRFKQRSGKPVIGLMMDVAASGGYYIACAADTLMAYPTAVTGSIGVIVQTVSLKPALNRLGIEADAITSGDNKDAGSWLSNLTPEKRAVLQALVDDFYQRFVDVVRGARPNIVAGRFDEMTDGRIVSGEEAAKAGLVDEVGDIYDAFALAKELAGIGEKRADLVFYHRPYSYVGSPYARTQQFTNDRGELAPGSGSIQINLAQLNLGGRISDMSSGFYYLWQPP